VRVTVQFGTSRQLADMLQTGKVDLAIVNSTRRFAGLTGVSLGETKFFLVVRSDHPLAAAETINPRELENHPFIGYEEGSETRTMMDAYFRRMSLSIEYALESSNVATIKHMVMAGLGLSLLPETAVGEEIRDGRLVRIDVQGLYMAQRMTLFYKTNRTLTPTRKEFLKFMEHELGAERELGVARRARKE
jgi:DNA-binding transcriptional LysR family regulator